jgi:hypothetical protein
MRPWQPLSSLLAPLRAERADARCSEDTGPAADRQASTSNPHFTADLHPLHRRFLAYRHGLADQRPHSLQETADHFGIDLALARLTEEYLQARRRFYVDRSGWRAARRYSR